MQHVYIGIINLTLRESLVTYAFNFTYYISL